MSEQGFSNASNNPEVSDYGNNTTGNMPGVSSNDSLSQESDANNQGVYNESNNLEANGCNDGTTSDIPGDSSNNSPSQRSNVNNQDKENLIEIAEEGVKIFNDFNKSRKNISQSNKDKFKNERADAQILKQSGSNPLKQWVISFQWNYNGKLINKRISKEEATRDNLNGAIIRIGREQMSSNLYVENSSVSRQHAEVYFDEQQQKFFIRSLQPKNITKVNGQNLVYGKELRLKEGTTILLGQQEIEVTSIQVCEIEPTNYAGLVHSNSNPLKQWVISFQWNYNGKLINKRISK